MRRIINILFTIMLGFMIVGCQKDYNYQQDGIYLKETIENVVVEFSVIPNQITIINDNLNYVVNGTTEELIDFIDDFNDSINYIRIESKEPTFVLAKKYHYYSGRNNITWIFSNNMTNECLNYLKQF